MLKLKQSLMKDELRHVGEYWVHLPSQNIRQASGVQFGGKYVSYQEYLKYMAWKRISKKS